MAKTFKSFVKEYAMGLQVPATSFMKPTASMNLQAKKKLKPELKEVVHKFMTGHDLTLNGKKHDKIEVEVTGTDNANRKYQLTILSPKELTGKKVSVSAKFMERGKWTKTDTSKHNKEDYDRDDEVSGKKVFKPAKHMPKDSSGKLDVTEPTRSHSPLKKAKKVDSKPKDGVSRTTPSTKYKGLAFTHSVPNYTKA